MTKILKKHFGNLSLKIVIGGVLSRAYRRFFRPKLVVWHNLKANLSV